MNFCKQLAFIAYFWRRRIAGSTSLVNQNGRTFVLPAVAALIDILQVFPKWQLMLDYLVA